MPADSRRRDRRPRRDDIVDELNRLLAEEAEASLRYFHMRYRLQQTDLAAAQPLLDEAIRDTLDHAAAIAAHIQSLGCVPTLRINVSLSGGRLRLDQALREALEVEQQALDAYKDLLPKVAGDPALEEFVRRQVEVETEHVREMAAFVESRSRLKLVPRKRTRPRVRP